MGRLRWLRAAEARQAHCSVHTGEPLGPLLEPFSESQRCRSMHSSACLDPADTEHVHQGKNGVGGGQETWTRGEGQDHSEREVPAHNPTWIWGGQTMLPVPDPSSPRGEACAGLELVGRIPGPMPSSDLLVGRPRPPTDSSSNRRRARAFAERQCHLVAGGTNARFLWDHGAHHTPCS